jgi:hypothetical protein
MTEDDVLAAVGSVLASSKAMEIRQIELRKLNEETTATHKVLLQRSVELIAANNATATKALAGFQETREAFAADVAGQLKNELRAAVGTVKQETDKLTGETRELVSYWQATATATAAEKSAQWRMLGWLIVTIAATYALVTIYRWAQEPKIITQTYYCPAKLLRDGSYQFIPGKQCSLDASKIP